MSRNVMIVIIVAIAAVVLVCCCCVGLALFGGLFVPTGWELEELGTYGLQQPLAQLMPVLQIA